MTLIQNTSTGRYDTDANEVMDHVRKPVFVDNAVHHGRISVQTSNKAKITVEKNNTRNLQVMPQTRYQIVESEGGVLLTHVQKSGHEYTGVPYFNGETLSSSNIPILLYNADNPSERIVLSDVENSTIGVFGNLRNMKGRTLQDIGFSSDIVKLGQPVDVGLRTTDLAIKLGESISGGATSVNIARPETIVAQNRAHSTRFVAQDFRNTNLMTSLRYLARHDGRMVILDTFGNLLYIPLSFTENTVEIKNRAPTVTVDNPIDDAPNRVTVQGLPMGLNDLVIVTVDDAESQVEEVREAPSVFVDHTVRNPTSAKRIARKVLRGHSLVKGKEEVNGNYNSLDVRPGMTVTHDGKNKIVTEVRHFPFANKSDFSLMNVEVGLEGILQAIDAGTTVEQNSTNPDTAVQVVDLNLAMFGRIELRIESKVVENNVYKTAMLIGGTSRGTIGGNAESIGGNKSTISIQRRRVGGFQ